MLYTFSVLFIIIDVLIIYCLLLIYKEMYAVRTFTPSVFIETIWINYFTNLINTSNLISIGYNINLFTGFYIRNF